MPVRLYVAIIAIWLSGALAGAFVVADTTTRTPYCPTEDACTIDYSDGQWTVVEVTP
jgi:hypothetical protein